MGYLYFILTWSIKTTAVLDFSPAVPCFLSFNKWSNVRSNVYHRLLAVLAALYLWWSSSSVWSGQLLHIFNQMAVAGTREGVLLVQHNPYCDFHSLSMVVRPYLGMRWELPLLNHGCFIRSRSWPLHIGLKCKYGHWLSLCKHRFIQSNTAIDSCML